MGAHRCLTALGWLVLAAIVPAATAGDDDALLLPKGELPEERLVDVAIDLFSSGISEATPEGLRNQGVRAAVRKSEARYFTIHLRKRLESRG